MRDTRESDTRGKMGRFGLKSLSPLTPLKSRQKATDNF